MAAEHFEFPNSLNKTKLLSVQLGNSLVLPLGEKKVWFNRFELVRILNKSWGFIDFS